ncbi:Rps4p [Trebouxia sp. C0010 RCD-2024]
MAGTGALLSSPALLRPTHRVTGSTHSCFLSGNSLRSVSHQCSTFNATRQVVTMSRYRGPRLRIVRRLGELPGLTQKTPKRQAPPGQHGATAKKPTQYGVRLLEKQKLRYNYGVTEHQLVNYVKKARRMKGSTGEILLQLLEMRLDSIVFRLGLAPTMSAARQIVCHGHITVNGRRVDIASYQCKPGETVGVYSQKQSKALVESWKDQSMRPIPNHLSTSEDGAKVTAIVNRQDVALSINELLIIEYYSRKM